MRKIGISIYPKFLDEKTWKIYIDKSLNLGYSRVFISLLEVSGQGGPLLERLKTIANYAKSKNMEVYVDIAPKILKLIGVELDDYATNAEEVINFFNTYGATAMRMDGDFGGKTEAMLSNNKQNFKVELNASSTTHLIDRVMSFGADRHLITACHNFYPQTQTGLSLPFFIESSNQFYNAGVAVAGFVRSHVGKLGPWAINDGLCTLEMHRNLPLKTQAKHMFMFNAVDDIIIGDAMASDEELNDLANVLKTKLAFAVNISKTASTLENTILFKEGHFVRGDMNDSFLRSTLSRVKYKGEKFQQVKYDGSIKKGDVLIGNDSFGNYKGELQIALKDMPNDNRKNKIASIKEHEIFLLDYIQPWQHFSFE